MRISIKAAPIGNPCQDGLGDDQVAQAAELGAKNVFAPKVRIIVNTDKT